MRSLLVLGFRNLLQALVPTRFKDPRTDEEILNLVLVSRSGFRSFQFLSPASFCRTGHLGSAFRPHPGAPDSGPLEGLAPFWFVVKFLICNAWLEPFWCQCIRVGRFVHALELELYDGRLAYAFDRAPHNEAFVLMLLRRSHSKLDMLQLM